MKDFRAMLAGIASCAMVAATLVAGGAAAAGPAMLYDTATGNVLHAEDIDTPWFPASVTKLMTAYLTFEAVKSGRLRWEDKLTLSTYARSQPATRINLRIGIDPTISEAVHGLILRSANDLAVALAEHIDGDEATFVARMNATARRLGMSRTRFTNPHGLPDPDSVTTARDMTLLARAILSDFPDQAGVFAERSTRIYRGTFHTQNDLLITLEGADGMKTGYTCWSGYNIVASATREGRRLIAVVFGMGNRQDRSAKTADLFEAGFAALGIKPQPSAAVAVVPRGSITKAAAFAPLTTALEDDDTTVPPRRAAATIVLGPPRPLDRMPLAPVASLAASDVSRTIRVRKCPRPDRPVARTAAPATDKQ